MLHPPRPRAGGSLPSSLKNPPLTDPFALEILLPFSSEALALDQVPMGTGLGWKCVAEPLLILT